MKVVTGDVLNRMPVGTVFCPLDMQFDQPDPGMPIQILSTLIDDDGNSFIHRTDDGLVESEERYSCCWKGDGLKGLNAPLTYHWGTSSVGCYDASEHYLVLDKEDIKKMCDKLLNPIVVPNERGTGFELANLKDCK